MKCLRIFSSFWMQRYGGIIRYKVLSKGGCGKNIEKEGFFFVSNIGFRTLDNGM